jgi:stage V sporulation protein S
MREHRFAEVQSIGAGAVNQAIKAVILAKGYLVNDGIDIICVPEFVDVDIEGKVRTAIKLTITPRGEDTAPEEEVSEEAAPEEGSAEEIAEEETLDEEAEEKVD